MIDYKAQFERLKANHEKKLASRERIKQAQELRGEPKAGRRTRKRIAAEAKRGNNAIDD